MESQKVMIPNTGTRMVLNEAKNQGVNIDKLILAHGIDPKTIMEDPDFLIPAPILRDIWKECHSLSGDRLLGLRAALAVPDNAYPVTDHLVRVASNVNEAFLSVSRYWKVTIPSLQLSFTPTKSGAVFEINAHTPAGVLVAREMVEYTFTLVLKRIHQFSTERWNPIQIEFQGSYPGDAAEHERILGCPVSFGAKTNRIILSKKTLDIKQLANDPSLFGLFTRLADEKLKTPKSQDKPILSEALTPPGNAGRVRLALEAKLSTQDMSVDVIASLLGMSTRTLQRKLDAEETSYQEVLDHLRMELAERFLKQRTLGKMTIDDISFLLGFSEPSAFYKAYRRWTGKGIPGRAA